MVNGKKKTLRQHFKRLFSINHQLPTLNIPMSESATFSDYLVFVDESGDHSLTSIGSLYPVFVLAFAVIRKSRDAFSFLLQKRNRECFMGELTGIMEALPATIVAVVIDKPGFAARHAEAHPRGVYDYAMEIGIQSVSGCLTEAGQAGRITPMIVERRGRKEDAEDGQFDRFATRRPDRPAHRSPPFASLPAQPRL